MSEPQIAERLRQVEEKVAQAAAESGREPGSVTLVAVSKTRSVAEIIEAVSAGALDLGENYAQEMAAKHEELAAAGLAEQSRWHYIGHLQRNKAKYLVGFCALIHSVDSVRLMNELERRAGQQQRKQPVLLQIDLAGEETKFGAPEEQLPELVAAALETEHLDWQGLMCMAPYSEDPESGRQYYRRLRELRDGLAEEGVAAEKLRHLSMGMTSDYAVAIAEGATIVRVGQAIFGPRDYHK